MNRQIKNQRVWVTGGSRGMGAAIVQRLACEGAHVALTYISHSGQAHEIAQAAQAPGVQAIAYRVRGAPFTP